MVPFSSPKNRVSKAAWSLEKCLPMSSVDALGSCWCRRLDRKSKSRSKKIFQTPRWESLPARCHQVACPFCSALPLRASHHPTLSTMREYLRYRKKHSLPKMVLMWLRSRARPWALPSLSCVMLDKLNYFISVSLSVCISIRDE